ncbi:MAG: tetratricopeptide repeat protein [Candidatus Acidiferrales bacterium]
MDRITNRPNRHTFAACAACLVLAGAFSWATVALRADTIPDTLKPLPTQETNAKYNQAVDLLGKGQLKEADALFQQLAASDPSEFDATLGRAQIAITQQRLDQADRMVDEVLKRQDNLPEAHNMKGVVLLLQKHPDQARREFSRAVELQPKYITPRLYLAVMAQSTQDYAGAAAAYKGITEVAPQLPAGYLGQANALMMMHREADGLNVLEGWKAADPKTLLPYQVLANVYLSDHEPPKAIQQLQAALAKSPHDSTTLTILGNAYAAAGDARSAAAQYQAALEANGANTDAALRLGELEAGEGHTDQALADFRQALKADPNNMVACNNIAWVLADQDKDLDEALRLAELAVKRDPKYADGRDTLGWVQYQRGEYSQAVSTLKVAKTLAPSSPDVAAHLGLAYAKTGQKQAALAELKRALAPGSNVSNRPELERVVAELSGNSQASHPQN